jgi:hypothetical protein
MKQQTKTEVIEKTSPDTNFFTKNFPRTNLGWNPGLRDESSVTGPQSHGTTRLLTLVTLKANKIF